MNCSAPRRLRGGARKARDINWVRREDAGESLADIARADGVSPEWVSKCVTRARREYGMCMPAEVAARRRARQRATAEKGRRSRSEALRARDDSLLDMWEGGHTAVHSRVGGHHRPGRARSDPPGAGSTRRALETPKGPTAMVGPVG